MSKNQQSNNLDLASQYNESTKKEKKQSSGKNRKKSVIALTGLKIKDQAEI